MENERYQIINNCLKYICDQELFSDYFVILIEKISCYKIRLKFIVVVMVMKVIIVIVFFD